MAISLKDKKVLVTGSSDGLGKLLALELSKLGAQVMLHGRNEEKLSKVSLEIELQTGKKPNYIISDFNKPEAIENSFKEITELDILVNNTGIWAEGDSLETEPSKIIEMVNVNISSYLLLARLMLPILKKSKFGQLINVSSVAGYEVPADYFHTYYSATKYALQGFSEALTKEYTDKNVRIMGFYPGGMETELFKKAGIEYEAKEPWMFNPIESVEAMIFMLTRNEKVNVKRLDLVNHLQI